MATNMTERQYLENVLAIENLNPYIKEETELRLAKLEARNDKRRNTVTPKQRENEELLTKIKEYLTVHPQAIASEVSTALEISTQKASGLLFTLVREGKVNKSEVGIKGKGRVKAYSLIAFDEPIEETEEVEEVES